MARETPGTLYTLEVADADLSGDQYKLVKIDSGTGKVVLCGAGESGLPLQNKPKADEACEVTDAGVSKVLAGAGFNANTALTSDASGQAKAALSGESICGFALEASGGAGELVSMRVAAAGAKVP